MAASKTQEGGAKSGSPTQSDVTDSPSASICLTRENTSTVLEGLIWDRSGLSDGGSTDDEASCSSKMRWRELVVDDREDGEKAAHE